LFGSRLEGRSVILRFWYGSRSGLPYYLQVGQLRSENLDGDFQNLVQGGKNRDGDFQNLIFMSKIVLAISKSFF
jgi:hypothetical protein